MSIRKPRLGKWTRRGIIGGIVASIVAVVMVTAPTGANFSASGTGSVQGGTATLGLSLSDGNNSQGTFALNFANLKPGTSVAQTLVVTNTGTIPANVSIGQPISGASFTPAAGQNPDPAQLQASIDGYLSPTGATAMPSSVGLGVLNPGQSRAYTVRVGLVSAAGNDWQGATFAVNTVTVTLNQA